MAAPTDAEIEEALDALNPRQRKFTLLVAEGLVSASQAAREAGYSPKTRETQAHALLRNPKVKRALRLLGARTAENASMTRDELAAWLTGAIRRVDHDPRYVEGHTTGPKSETIRYTGRVPAAQLLARICGWEQQADPLTGDTLLALINAIREGK